MIIKAIHTSMPGVPEIAINLEAKKMDLEVKIAIIVCSIVMIVWTACVLKFAVKKLRQRNRRP